MMTTGILSLFLQIIIASNNFKENYCFLKLMSNKEMSTTEKYPAITTTVF